MRSLLFRLRPNPRRIKPAQPDALKSGARPLPAAARPASRLRLSLPTLGKAPGAAGPPAPARPRPQRRLRPSTWNRYTLGLVGLLALGLITRLPLIWSAPLDTPSGPQATMAAFVRRLAQNGGDIKGAVPWLGPLPIDLTGGVPLYAWIAAIVSAVVGPQPWVGRALSLLAALAATGLLFVVVRRLAGGRAALYAALFLTIAPPGLYYGRAYLPDALGWATACAALAAALRWQDGSLAGRADEQRWFGIAAGTAALALLVAPANLAVLPPLLYIAGARRRFSGGPTPAQGAGRHDARLCRARTRAARHLVGHHAYRRGHERDRPGVWRRRPERRAGRARASRVLPHAR